MVTAKFKVGRITPHTYDDDNNVTTGEVEMIPDYAQGKNESWSNATPSGVIRLSISNPEAFKQFVGDGYNYTGKVVDISLTISDK